ncbi:regulatory protein RecX [Tsuneonella mangrovi]|uniref:regulatory protein RecX n=1 Tax=Tsuneonella mangrovi TaxID=1982042 RepID=UPI001F0B6334|nr:RecX family transcriptional regulator [Tsuneonella mangrovi]
MSAPRARKRRNSRPLDPQKLEELALSYVARFATSAGKLRSYLVRKLCERGWDGGMEPDLDAIIARFVDAGYVDDAAWARAKSGGLLNRGYGPRRVAQALAAGGIAEEIREETGPDEAAARRAVLTLARRRRFGPWGASPLDRPQREKQIAAMVRAGHGFDAARAVVDAPSIALAEDWAAEAEEPDNP